MKNVLVVITNRASYPRAKSLIAALDCHVALMDPELDIEMELGERVVSRIQSRFYGGLRSMVATAGHLMEDIGSLIESVDPRAVICVGDRHEVLAVAAAARMMNRPVVHLLAGERSGSVDDSIRFAVSALADLLLAPHLHAQKELLSRGYKNVRITGCPSIDLCDAELPDISGLSGYGHGAEIDGPFYLACLHPDTTITAFDNVSAMLRLCDRMKPYSVVWVRPTQHDAYGREMDKVLLQHAQDGWQLVRHIPHNLMLSVIDKCIAMIGNSSMMYREAAYMGVPCVAIGHRQHGRVVTQNIVADLPKERGRVTSDPIWVSGGGKAAAREICERYMV
ncbi:MAG: UDP-N-acetylglucosamine 2-epimerase [Nitrososphaera sp.]